MTRRAKVTYYILSIFLFAVFLFSFTSSAIAIWLKAEWEITLEIWHYLSFLVAFTSWVGAQVILKMAQRPVTSVQAPPRPPSGYDSKYQRYDGFDDY